MERKCQAALEFHIPFNRSDENQYPSDFVFDLDPSAGQTFDEVVEVALFIKKELERKVRL